MLYSQLIVTPCFSLVKQDKILEKHIKLEYEVICPCPNDALQKWEELFISEASYDTLESAIKYGMDFNISYI